MSGDLLGHPTIKLRDEHADVAFAGAMDTTRDEDGAGVGNKNEPAPQLGRIGLLKRIVRWCGFVH